jgi:nucleolar GTP-binding protein
LFLHAFLEKFYQIVQKMVAYNFKNIRTVPPGKEIIDIILSKTQRQTPTVVHPGYSIQRIRAFYMRKVKFTSETITERLDRILEDFPRLDDVHPFYADLCNVLYDRDHYKLALGQINIAKHLVNNVARDYTRMLKYGDSLYRCKQLKRAALGRMCTILKKQAPSLSYLEEVRKHLSRLPSIDPNSRTLLITGFPNVGKSSFMNQVTHADVDVQPYAFTTKSLFVGHMDYKYLRWQVIDSPGVLDKPLEERNTIEMQAITALAHLQCCVLYFFDVSEQCGWSIDQQAALFSSLRPLFAAKPLVVVANKVDVVPLEELDPAKREMIEKLAQGCNAPLLPMSAMNAVGITNVKRTACEALLERRVEQKARSQKIGSVLNRLTVSEPKERDNLTRPPSIPESVLKQRETIIQAERHARQNFRQSEAAAYEDAVDAEEAEEIAASRARKEAIPKTTKTARDLMWEAGGPGVYSVDLREHYKLHNEEWTHDVIPEIMDGKNISDFVDPDIEERLEELDREEEELRRELDGKMETDDGEDDLDEEEKETLSQIRAAKSIAKKESQSKKKTNASRMPRAATASRKTNDEIQEELEAKGYDASRVKVGMKRRRAESDHDQSMEIDEPEQAKPARGVKRTRHDPNPGEQDHDPRRGVRTGEMYQSAEQKKKAMKKFQKARSVMRIKKGQLSESDHFATPKLLKHMLTGKRGIGKLDRR